MLKKRIIPCLDIRDGRTVKGIHFENIQDAGDPVELAERYMSEGADELIFLDITATVEDAHSIGNPNCFRGTNSFYSRRRYSANR